MIPCWGMDTEIEADFDFPVFLEWQSAAPSAMLMMDNKMATASNANVVSIHIFPAISSIVSEDGLDCVETLPLVLIE